MRNISYLSSLNCSQRLYALFLSFALAVGERATLTALTIWSASAATWGGKPPPPLRSIKSPCVGVVHSSLSVNKEIEQITKHWNVYCVNQQTNSRRNYQTQRFVLFLFLKSRFLASHCLTCHKKNEIAEDFLARCIQLRIKIKGGVLIRCRFKKTIYFAC